MARACHVAQLAGLNERQVRRVFAAIAELLARGETVNMRRVGVFALSARRARIWIRPTDGRALDLPETRTIRFRPAAALRLVATRTPIGAPPRDRRLLRRCGTCKQPIASEENPWAL